MKFPDVVFELWRFTTSSSQRYSDDGAIVTTDLALYDGDIQLSGSTKPTRQIEYQRGRAIARRVISELNPNAGGLELPRLGSGACAWPEGITCSISHSRLGEESVFAVAGALSRKIVGIGVDIEFTDRPTKPELLKRITSHAERERFPEINALTALSIKESLFKALYPLTNVYFGFQDAELISLGSGEFTIRLLKDLSDVHLRGHEFSGASFTVDNIQIATISVPPVRLR